MGRQTALVVRLIFQYIQYIEKPKLRQKRSAYWTERSGQTWVVLVDCCSKGKFFGPKFPIFYEI